MLSTPALVLAMMLFSLGLVGLLSRRNILYMLLSLEIMLNAAALRSLPREPVGDKSMVRSCSCSSSPWRRLKSPWRWGSCCSCHTDFVHWTRMHSAR